MKDAKVAIVHTPLLAMLDMGPDARHARTNGWKKAKERGNGPGA